MRIGLISDIHSNIYGLKAVLAELKDTDKIICAGDITGYYTFVNEVFEELEENQVQYIRGNFDEFLWQKNFSKDIIQQSVEYTLKTISAENLEALKNASESLNLELGGLRINVYHESPWGSEERIYPDFAEFDKFNAVDADVIVLGHTHYPMIKTVGEKLVINPGSCGQPRDYDTRASYAILDTDLKKAEIKRVEYDYEKVIEEIKKKSMSQELINILKRTR